MSTIQLADHAEDWDKTEKLNSSLTMINSDMGPSSKRDKTFRYITPLFQHFVAFRKLC